jgi:putative cell wall-binding protein
MLTSIGLPTAVLSPTQAVQAHDTPALSVLPAPGRIAGADRYEQAVRASALTFPTAAIVYLASGESFPDALSAASVAGIARSPLLLVPRERVPDTVIEEIRRTGATTAVIVGGRSAVDDAVLLELSRRLTGVTVTRVEGDDRHDTSRRLITDELVGVPGARALMLASGSDFPDALSAAAPAGALGAPVLLVDGKQSVPTPAEDMFLDRLGPASALIVGGPSSVSPALQATLTARFPLERLSGADRYSTGVVVNHRAFSTASRAFLASGTGFPDALSGGPIAARWGAPLFVVQPDCIPKPVLDELTRIGPDTITLLGGESTLGRGVARLTPC